MSLRAQSFVSKMIDLPCYLSGQRAANPSRFEREISKDRNRKRFLSMGRNFSRTTIRIVVSDLLRKNYAKRGAWNSGCDMERRHSDCIDRCTENRNQFFHGGAENAQTLVCDVRCQILGAGHTKDLNLRTSQAGTWAFVNTTASTTLNLYTERRL